MEEAVPELPAMRLDRASAAAAAVFRRASVSCSPYIIISTRLLQNPHITPCR